MKKLLLFVIVFVAVSCSKDEGNSENHLENYINIDGDTRNLDDPELTIIDIYAYQFNGNSYEPDGFQFVVDAYDPDKNVIGDISDFGNDELEFFIDVFPMEDPAFQQISSFETYIYDDLQGMSNSEEMFFKRNKALLTIRIKNDDDVIFYADASSGQNVNIKYNEGFYNIKIDNMLFNGVRYPSQTPKEVVIDAEFKIAE